MRTLDVNPYRITREIRDVIDAAKMNDSWECELEDRDFDFLVGGKKEDSIMWENVRVFRKGKREEILERESMTSEELVAQEEEISRKRREEREKLGGRLKRPDIPDYHPKKGPA